VKLTEKNIRNFWKKVKAADEASCWNWTASKRNGYGAIKINGKMRPSHRVSWIIHNGKIPKGLHVLHRCDNPVCCNPNHLFLGTHAENMKDRDEKGRVAHNRGEKNGRAKLTKEAVIEIFYDIDTNVKIAKKHGISRYTVRDIKNYKRWQHVTKFL